MLSAAEIKQRYLKVKGTYVPDYSDDCECVQVVGLREAVFFRRFNGHKVE